MARDKDDEKKKKFRAKGKDKDDERDDDDDDDDDEEMERSARGGSSMNELQKAQRELQETLHEENGGGKRPSVKDAVLGFVDSLNRSATQLSNLFKAEGYGEGGSDGGGGDSGNDPDYQNKERKKLAKRKGGMSDNHPDNESYEEQEGRQEETIEEAEGDMDGSTLVSGAGKRNAVFHNPGGGQRVDLTDKSAKVRDDLYRSLADDEDYVQVLEASPALAHLTDVVAEALGNLGAQVEQLAGQLNTMGKSMATLMRSQAALNKSFITAGDGSSTTRPGVIARVTDGKGPEGVYSPNGAPQNLSKSDDKMGGLRKSDIVEKLEAAIADGKAPPEELSRFDAAGLNGLTISDEIRKSYGIPLTQ